MKKINVDDFTKYSYLSNVKFSPNGVNKCFVVTKASKEKNSYESNIYSLEKDNKVKQITAGNHEGNFEFISDNDLIFAAKREESKEKSLKTTYYKISLDGGEATPYFTLPIPGSVTKLKNGDFIVKGSTFKGFEDLYKGDPKLEKAYFDNLASEADYEVIEQNPWWWNGSTFTKGNYQSLYYYNFKKNKLTRLTKEGISVSGFEVSKDEKYVLFMGQVIKPHNSYSEGTLYKLDLTTLECDEIFTSSEDFVVYDFSFADDFVLVEALDKTICNGIQFYKLDVDNKKLALYSAFGESVGSTVGSDVRYGGGRSTKMVGNTFYFVSTIKDNSYLYQLKDGIITCVINKEGSIDDFDIYNDKLLMVALYDMMPQELYNEQLKRVTHFNDVVLKNTYVAKPEKLNVVVPAYEDTSRHFYNYNAHEIHGFVLKPYGFEEGKKYPVIIDIHGGPKTVYGPVFYHEMQYWASLGYFVIYCNPTGSDGRNREHFDDIYGKYGTIDYDDIMYFCDKALEAYPEMDSTNFFETGGSYGGFMTNWIIGHTDRFKACASQRSISNWFSFYGVSDIGIEFLKDQHHATPWTDPQKLWWFSPMKYLDKCHTPTLFIHSNEDYRCPIDQGYQMVTSLIDQGVDCRLVHFKGENHELSRSGKPLHRIRRLNEITNWFLKYTDDCYKK